MEICKACKKAEEMLEKATTDYSYYYTSVAFNESPSNGSLALMAEHLKEFHCTCEKGGE